MDCEDVKFLEEELLARRKLDVNHFTFEDMMDKLEKNSTVNAVTIKEAKLILKEDDDLILLVYDYWLNKRLATQQSLVPSIKTVNYSQSHNPYVCFRRRTEKMMTRKNRKNEEASYESMLKLRRDLSRAVTLLDMVRRREKTKKEKLNLTLDIFNKRHNSQDWDGKLMETVTASLARQRLQSTNLNIHSWMSLSSPSPPRKSYKLKRRRGPGGRGSPRLLDSPSDRMISSEDETGLYAGSDDDMEESKSPFVFTRREGVQYHAPLDDLTASNTQNREASEAFVLTGMRLGQSLRCLGHCRRRVGRGGRVVIDRLGGKYDESEEMMARAVTPPGLEDDMDSHGLDTAEFDWGSVASFPSQPASEVRHCYTHTRAHSAALGRCLHYIQHPPERIHIHCPTYNVLRHPVKIRLFPSSLERPPVHQLRGEEVETYSNVIRFPLLIRLHFITL